VQLLNGYKCENGQVRESGAPCKAASVKGEWTFAFQQQPGDTTTRTVQVGWKHTSSHEVADSYTFKVSFKEEVHAGTKLNGGSLTSEQSLALSNTVTDQISDENSLTSTLQKKYSGSGVYWQFVLTSQNKGTCGAHESILMLPDLLHTPNMDSPPCCAPGLFKDMRHPEARTGCAEGAPMTAECQYGLVAQLSSVPALSSETAIGNISQTHLATASVALSMIGVMCWIVFTRREQIMHAPPLLG
jgi:hypothetical protein